MKDGEEFEYLIQSSVNPSNKDLNSHEYDSKEYKILEHHRMYFRFLLNELGSKGWELITLYNDSYQPIDKETIRVSTLILKRNSKSPYFKLGPGIDFGEIEKLAKTVAEESHIDFKID